MTTFIQPDYKIGNSADCQTQMIGVLQGLDQALQALQPSPATNVVQFNNSILLADPASSSTNTMSNGLIVMTDGTNTSTLGVSSLLFSNTSIGNAININASTQQIIIKDGTNTGTLTTTTWSGSAVSAGSSTYASSVNIVDLTTGTNYPILYNPITTAGYNNLAMDVGTGNHFNYSPSTNKINIGGTTNGGIAVVGTASTISVAGTGTALSCPNATAINFGSSTITGGTFSGALSGTATNATNITTTSDNTSGTYYIPFSKTSAGTSTALYLDDTTTALTYNPSTSTITATTFVGALTGTASSATTATTATTATNITTTSDNTSGTYYIPFSKTSAGTSTALYLDDTTGPLTYNPSTATLTASVFVGGTINGTSGVLLQYNGTTQSSITTNGVQETLLTTQGTATYSSPTLTLLTTASAPYPTTYGNIITFSGSAVAQTISAIVVPTNMPVNAMYYCYITNSNTSAGAITINATSLGTGIKTTYTSAVVIPISGFALGTLTKVGSSAFVWSVNVVA